jgi:ribulose-phosphate 3-epimerase
MSQSVIVAPSLLSADFACLRDAVDMINRSKAQWIHWDVMDGRFVPNITFGMPVVKALRPHSVKFFDVHLMIENPGKYVEAFADAGADMITVHYEATTHLHRVMQMVKNKGKQFGVAINPATPVGCIQDIIPYADLVLIMSVNPGFGGQEFIDQSLEKLKAARQWIDELNPACKLEVDGGINEHTAPLAVEAGADVLVAGSYVFRHDNPTRAIETLASL